jgi:hypothetical protein
MRDRLNSPCAGAGRNDTGGNASFPNPAEGAATIACNFAEA